MEALKAIFNLVFKPVKLKGARVKGTDNSGECFHDKVSRNDGIYHYKG